MNGTISKLFSFNGSYSLPYLINIHDKGRNIDMYFVNDTKDHEVDGKLYKAEAFNYQPRASEYGFSGGGTLEISVVGNQVIDLIELYSDISIDVTGVLQENGEIAKLNHFSHHNGKVTLDRNKATFSLSREERLDMSFPALIFNAQNNRGNS